MLLRILILTLCCTLVSCKGLVEKYKRSNSGVSALEKKVLFDFRHYSPTEIAARQPCLAGPPNCSVVVRGNVDGAFTYAAESEHACLYRCADTNRLIVYANGKTQASSDTPYSSIAATFDLNGDDKNELLLVGETLRNGETSREASLETFEKNSLRAVENFGIVYHDSCVRFAGADDAKRKELIAQGLTPHVEAVVISYLPRPGHEMPSFTAQRMRAPCPTTPNAQPSNWEVVSPR